MFFTNKKKDFDPTQLAYVEPDEPEVPAETPLGAPPPQQTPAPIPFVPPQPAVPPQPPTPAPVVPPPAPQQPAPVPPAPPVQPVATQPAVPPPASPPSIFSSSPDSKSPASERTKPGSSPTVPGKQAVTTIAVVILLLGLAAGGFYGFQHFQKGKPASSTKKTVAMTPSKPPQKVLGIVDSVRKQVSNLPTDETPTVATVTNLAKLQGQAFFAKAKKGDKVLIYANAKKAYLYRPSTNAIIQESEVEVAGDKSSAATASAETTSDSGKPVLKIKF